MVPNLEAVAREHGITRRTLERVRAKMRRMGLIDHVSRFNASYGGREGWVLSGRFERSLRLLAEQTGKLKDSYTGLAGKRHAHDRFCRGRPSQGEAWPQASR